MKYLELAATWNFREIRQIRFFVSVFESSLKSLLGNRQTQSLQACVKLAVRRRIRLRYQNRCRRGFFGGLVPVYFLI